MSAVVTVLAAIGLIVVISYLIYYLYKYISSKVDQKRAEDVYPPDNYMQNSGLKCPDYWVNTGVTPKGDYVCHNSFNIDTVNPTSGSYAGKCNPTNMIFPKIDKDYTWEYGDPDGLTSYTYDEKYDFLNKSVGDSLTRCQWINNCGPSQNVQGIWSGVNEICNSPPTS